METLPKLLEKRTQRQSGNCELNFRNLEKSILAETKEQDATRCQSILNKFSPEKCEIEPLDSDSGEISKNSELCIYFSIFRDAKLVQSLKHLKFLDLNWFSFNNVDSKNMHLVDFLESSFPNKTNALCFWSKNGMDLNRSNYLNPLINLSSKVSQKCHFNLSPLAFPHCRDWWQLTNMS
ncbi:unnamed protein product [Moneuplotes crassus]|uniref:Uncharacterized protein n=1 Tax=Euplotes crassus TaxID=5936 RepID=A0AAD1UU75_EUPCR|nr:unnamed protein product [Moneuplotes crassus]